MRHGASHWPLNGDVIERRQNLMPIDVDAVYENGIHTLKQPVDYPRTPRCT